MGMTKVCVVGGVGPGTGAACARRFAEAGYQVALLARNRDRLESFASEIEGSRAYPVDMTDREIVFETVERIKTELGPVDVLVQNGAGGAFTNFMDTDPEVLERNFRINTMALLHMGQAVVPHMRERGSGAVMVTGNTSARRGLANFAAFAPTKASQRILAESMARLLGPEGIHVAYFIIDAVIDLAWTREMMPDRKDEEFAKPADLAETVYQVSQQPRSAWSFEVDLRPFCEKW